MDNFELKISTRDWINIIIIGSLFGFFISLFFYFISPMYRDYSTIFFSVQTALFISIFSIIFISLSNGLILPNVNKRFWYVISFGFAFISGSLGFLSSYYVGVWLDYQLMSFIAPYKFYISATIGFLTFLIGLILHQFISMKYKHENAKNDILESKIRALENELNPHFLFNALNSVSELIYSNPKKAENAVVELSIFLRNAISKESLIDIEDEISMVETYVNIENIRFQNNIILSVQNHLPKVMIPKFSIQLLVENAIKHGYYGEKLTISIVAKDNKITISNNGKSPENIICGTGLNNLKKRLKILNIGRLSNSNIDCLLCFTITLKD